MLRHSGALAKTIVWAVVAVLAGTWATSAAQPASRDLPALSGPHHYDADALDYDDTDNLVTTLRRHPQSPRLRQRPSTASSADFVRPAYQRSAP